MAKGNHNKKKDVRDLTAQGLKRRAVLELTKLIKQIGLEPHTVDDDGRVINKAEALARIVWDKALGYEEKILESGEKIIHKPDRAFISMILDRTEGKVTQAIVSGEKIKTKLADRIGEQSKARLNKLARSDE